MLDILNIYKADVIRVKCVSKMRSLIWDIRSVAFLIMSSTFFLCFWNEQRKPWYPYLKRNCPIIEEIAFTCQSLINMVPLFCMKEQRKISDIFEKSN